MDTDKGKNNNPWFKTRRFKESGGTSRIRIRWPLWKRWSGGDLKSASLSSASPDTTIDLGSVPGIQGSELIDALGEKEARPPAEVLDRLTP
jgi:hypothetical protein